MKSRHLKRRTFEFRIRGPRKVILGSVVFTLALSLTGVSPVHAQSVDSPIGASEVIAAQVNSGVLESAVEAFASGDADSAAKLADAVAPQDEVNLDDSEFVSLSSDGGLVLEHENGLRVGMAVKDSQARTEIIDGSAVATKASTDLDVVSRATSDGAQILTVLGSKDAPNNIPFNLDLPKDARLAPQHDGSILVLAPVGPEASTPNGTAIPEAEAKSLAETLPIARIDTPWAIDAEGSPVNTRFELEGANLVQIVETDRNTIFPVIADPAWAPILVLAAKQCAKGALAGVAATALVDFVKGKKSKKSDYILNAAASCIVAAGGLPIGIAMKSTKVRKWAATQLVKIILKIRR